MPAITLCVGVLLVILSVVAGYIGASANGMILNSHMVDRNHRYFAVDRSLHHRILKEITPEEFESRTRYDNAGRVLAAVGFAVIVGAGVAFGVFRAAEQR